MFVRNNKLMETINCIKTRRSRRKFLDKDVSDEIIKRLIDSARHAPSSMDSQPWEFVIIKDNEIKKGLTSFKEKENEEYILGAKIIIAVCVDKEKSETRWIEDGVCAVMNILLEAHNLGLGAVYVTGYNNRHPEITKGIQELLKLPENIMPVALIPLGYSDSSEELEKKELREVNEMIHFDKW